MAADDTLFPEIEHEPAIKRRPVDLRYFTSHGYVSPDWVHAQVTHRSAADRRDWDRLDDELKDLGSDPARPTPTDATTGWRLVPTTHLRAVEERFLALGLPHRLRVQKLPSATP